ncbi:protein HEXIM1 [Nematostella vectensis]|uniref:protein HEXIM1 n=1 Tax=Nematostella vectensis TaxID=45351 RepID=UPI0020779B16|nr:protein HEXIM1 [Nematostella vectensis]
MCSIQYSRKTKMNPEGLPSKAMKRQKKTRRLKKRKRLDKEIFDFSVVPVKRAKGRTAAPENTTQFLMDDHEKFEPFVLSSPSLSPNSSGCEFSSSSVRGSPVCERDLQSVTELVGNFDELYFEKDFNDVYDSIHAETLLGLSKQELIYKYMELEKKEENLLRDSFIWSRA